MSDGTVKTHLSRRTVMRSLLYASAGIAASSVSGYGYVKAIEPDWLKVERIPVTIAGLPPAFDGYRIAQLSDLHLIDEGSYKRAMRAVKLAMELDPDLIVLTGDYVTSFVDGEAIREVVQQLDAPDGVWTTMGNHDHWTNVAAVREATKAAGAAELRNSHVAIEHDGEKLWLAGVDDIWMKQHNLAWALDGIPEGDPTILLAHEPDYADEVFPIGRVSLQLSGHSHGGQARLPFLGTPVTPYLGQKYPYGLRELGSMQLYTNRGVGNLYEMRFNCRPEVTEITLRT